MPTEQTPSPFSFPAIEWSVATGLSPVTEAGSQPKSICWNWNRWLLSGYSPAACNPNSNTYPPIFPHHVTHPYRAKREQRERVKMTIQIFFQPLRLADTSPAVPRSIAEHGRGGVKSNSLSHLRWAEGVGYIFLFQPPRPPGTPPIAMCTPQCCGAQQGGEGYASLCSRYRRYYPFSPCRVP